MLLRLVLFFSALACNRYEYVPDYLTPGCQHSEPPARSGPPVRTTASPDLRAGVIVGQVWSQRDQRPVNGAIVVISNTFWKADTTDALGRFEFSNVPGGQYELIIRRLGYKLTRDSLLVASEEGLEVHAQLEEGVIALDGSCSGYVSVAVRKPWWKLW